MHNFDTHIFYSTCVLKKPKVLHILHLFQHFVSVPMKKGIQGQQGTVGLVREK